MGADPPAGKPIAKNFIVTADILNKTFESRQRIVSSLIFARVYGWLF